MDTIKMAVQLESFQNISSDTYTDENYKLILKEMCSNIKENSTNFRILFELESTNILTRIYKNAITSFFINKGYKVVNVIDFILIDWSKPNLEDTGTDPINVDLDFLGPFFSANEIYSIITNFQDFRKVSLQSLYYLVKTEVKAYNINPVQSSVISVGLSTEIDPVILNNLFAGELYQINQIYSSLKLSFVSGGLLQITFDDVWESYLNDIDPYIIFGTRKNYL